MLLIGRRASVLSTPESEAWGKFPKGSLVCALKRKQETDDFYLSDRYHTCIW